MKRNENHQLWTGFSEHKKIAEALKTEEFDHYRMITLINFKE
jgi:hypothetical protein